MAALPSIMSDFDLRFTGDVRVAVDATVPTETERRGGAAADAVITGRVHNPAGLGLGGAHVVVTVPGDRDDTIDLERDSDATGRFRVVVPHYGASAAVPVRYRVTVAGGDDHLDVIALVDGHTDVVLTDGRGALDLVVELDAGDITGELLAMVADAAAGAGLDRADLLVAELPSVSSSAFADLPLAQRTTLAVQLEQAFLDPTGVLREVAGPVPSLSALQDHDVLLAYLDGAADHLNGVAAAAADLAGKAASFTSFADVDWPLSIDDLRQGDLSATVNRFADRFRVGLDLDLDLDPHQFDTHTSDRIRYRDYLRDTWTFAASRVVVTNGVHLTDKQARQQLDHRFHQDFRTVDDAVRPANEVVAEILTDILGSPTGGGYGFGVAAASIPARGTNTARQHLDALIARSGESAAELTRRYHLDLDRPDLATSSPVNENITTLQGFLRDTFQAGAEPYPVAPDVLGEPIVPSKLQGHAPFFLYYEEWLEQQRSFHGENHLDIRRIVTVVMDKANRDAVQQRAFGGGAKPLGPGGVDYTDEWTFVAAVLGVTDALEVGHTHLRNGELPLAQKAYETARDKAIDALASPAFEKRGYKSALMARRALAIKDMPSLLDFQQRVRNDNAKITASLVSEGDWPDTMAVRLALASFYVLPVCRGDVALAMGDFANAVFHFGQATRFVVSMARLSDKGGYKATGDGFGNYFGQFAHGELPYTVVLDENPRVLTYAYPYESESDSMSAATTIENKAAAIGTRVAHAVEIKLFKLRQADAMLEWADSLYRTDTAASIQRARELYKGVLWLWGEAPPIVPRWPGDLPIIPDLFKQRDENPAIVSQKQRARLGIYKVDAGLNWFGESADVVPVLRFRPLKEQADRMAASAKGAQLDFLQATEKVESALVEQMRLNALVEKSTLQASIGTEQIAIAKADVEVAKEQVAAVEAQIAAKQAEMAKADSLFSQFGDFAGGMVKTFTSLPTDTKSAIGAGVASEATGDAMVGEGMLGLGAGASVMTGFGVFAVAGYLSMSGMADAANARIADLATLRDKALPAAQRSVQTRQHAQRIAELQKQIAEVDLDLARRLIAFEQDKLLNVVFWVNIAQLARRLMRRYLDMGGRLAWLAERALAYEQDRPLHHVRLDYHLERLQGVTGADLLSADLAELELARVEGLKRTAPVTRTVSLARDFPLAFGQLKATGRCGFRTIEADLRRAHPGTHSYRVRAVSVSVSQTDLSAPLRGALVNQGVSVSRPDDPDSHVLVRPAETLPISEFRLHDDLAVFGLPDETLLPFEGSAVESFWEVELPPAANTANLESLLDVQITFDLRAQFDPRRRTIDLAAPPTKVRRWALFSAAILHPDAVGDLQGPAGNVLIEWALDRLPLAAQEHKRTVTNAAVIAVDEGRQAFAAELVAVGSGTTVPVALTDGWTASTLPPDPAAAPLPPTPLDVLAGESADQRFRLAVDKAGNPGVDFAAVRDVVLALEYEAEVP